MKQAAPLTSRQVLCPYCRNAALLVSGATLYPRRPDLAAAEFYACTPCGAHVGIHRNSPTREPLGTLANAALRQLRRQVHAKFDPLWQSRSMGRRDAYAWLARELGIAFHRCHVAWFDEAMCTRALAALNRRGALDQRETLEVRARG